MENLKDAPVLIIRGTNDKVVDSVYNIAQKDFYEIHGANVKYEVKPWAHMQAIVTTDTYNFPKVKCDDSSSTGFLNCEEEYDTAGEVLGHLLPNIYSTFTPEDGRCTKKDEATVSTGRDWSIGEKGDPEDVCQSKCRKDPDCSAYEYNTEDQTCKHWLGEVKGDGTVDGGYTCQIKQQRELQPRTVDW